MSVATTNAFNRHFGSRRPTGAAAPKAEATLPEHGVAKQGSSPGRPIRTGTDIHPVLDLIEVGRIVCSEQTRRQWPRSTLAPKR